MLLAAGLGERLRPLTLTTPKPLIPVGGRPLIEYNLILLKKFGVKKVMINLHHLGGMIREQIGDGKKWELDIQYSEEEKILGTGGGVEKVKGFFENQPFFLINADILIDLDLKKLSEFHNSQKTLATLVVTSTTRKDIQNWVFSNHKDQIVKIGEESPDPDLRQSVFTGVHLIEPEILSLLPSGRPSCIIQDTYVPGLARRKKLSAYPFEGYWRDLGTPERYGEVQKEFASGWPYTTLKPDDFT